MIEIRVKDVFPVSNGIMSAISESCGYNLNADMDLRLLAMCGKRCISPTVELVLDSETSLSDEALARLTSLLVFEYKESWDKIRNTLMLEYNPLSASQYNEVESIDESGENTDTNNNVTQSDIPTFDKPDNYVSDSKNSSETKGSGTTKSTSKRTLTRTSNSTNYKPVDLLKSEIDMRVQNKFISRIMEDVKNYISMPIY